MSQSWSTKRRTVAEAKAIESHRMKMCTERGCEVDLTEAEADWLEHHAEHWRQHRQCHCMSMQRAEIERHKWIRSEQAQRDLGPEAVFEWIRDYAAEWRVWYEKEHESV